MMHDRARYEELKRKIAAAQAEADALALELREQAIGQDVALNDRCMSVAKLWDSGDLEELQKTVMQIAARLQIERPLELEVDPWDAIESGANGPKPLDFPPEYDLAEIFIERGEMVVVGAPKKVGKTTWMCNTALYWALSGLPVVIFSVEMKIWQIWIKLFQAYAAKERKRKHAYDDVREWLRHKASFREYVEDFRKFTKMIKKNLLVIDSRGRTAKEICAANDLCENKLGRYPEVSFVDYLQRVQPEADTIKLDPRQRAMAQSNIFTNKSNETGKNFVVFSQLNKDGDYKESGAMGEDGALLLKLKRERFGGKWGPDIVIEVADSRFTPIKTSVAKFDGISGAITKA